MNFCVFVYVLNLVENSMRLPNMYVLQWFGAIVTNFLLATTLATMVAVLIFSNFALYLRWY